MTRHRDGASAALLAAGWAEVSDRLLTGLADDLEGRVKSLAGLVRLVEMEPKRSRVGDFVQEEIERLADAVRLLSLLRRPLRPEEPVALEPGVHLPRLLDLHARAREFGGVRYEASIDSEVSALAPSDLHARLVLCGLSATGWEALARDGRVDIHVRAGASDLVMTLDVPGEAILATERPPAAACPGGIEELASAMGGSGTWTATPDRARLEMRLPAAP